MMYKNIDQWIWSYLRQELKRRINLKRVVRPIHLLFCVVDHFEPDWNHADEQTQRKRVDRWVSGYPAIAGRHKDAYSNPPQHSFFYPAEVYHQDHLDRLTELCRRGFGEVEVQLHHDQDHEEGLRAKLEKAKQDFSRHGLLGKDKKRGGLRFAFIHGNWALNNSRADGRWCGVNDEARVLKESGCYADFTLPSAPSETQTRKINSIYYASSNPQYPKSHDTGKDVRVGCQAKGDLMIIQGPLALRFKKPELRLSIENAGISGNNPPTEDRIDCWIRQRIGVVGRPDWVFVKIHTHGAVEKNADVLLGEPMERMWSYLESKYNDGKNFVLHYVTARQMYNIIKAAEAGERGSPEDYRDYVIIKNHEEE